MTAEKMMEACHRAALQVGELREERDALRARCERLEMALKFVRAWVTGANEEAKSLDPEMYAKISQHQFVAAWREFCDTALAEHDQTNEAEAPNA
jgi:hypothetical protein